MALTTCRCGWNISLFHAPVFLFSYIQLHVNVPHCFSFSLPPTSPLLPPSSPPSSPPSLPPPSLLSVKGAYGSLSRRSHRVLVHAIGQHAHPRGLQWLPERREGNDTSASRLLHHSGWDSTRRGVVDSHDSCGSVPSATSGLQAVSEKGALSGRSGRLLQ